MRSSSSLMFDGTEPEAREQICRQDFIGNYRKLTLTDPAAVDPALIGRGVELEIRESPEIDNWDGETPLAVGCNGGGKIDVAAGDAGTEYTFTKCAMWPNVVLDGTGTDIEEGGSQSRPHAADRRQRRPSGTVHLPAQQRNRCVERGRHL